MTSARYAAFKILIRFDVQDPSGLKSDELLNEQLKQQSFSEADRGLLSRLLYGTLRHWLELNVYIETLANRPLRKLEPKVRVLARMALYQMLYLERIPTHAAVNESLKIAKKEQLSSGAQGLLNAVLRHYGRLEHKDDFRKELAKRSSSEIHYSLPDWLYQHWQENTESKTLQESLEASLLESPLGLRINTLAISPNDYFSQLNARDIPFIQPDIEQLPEYVLLKKRLGSPALIPGFSLGHSYIQDLGSARIATYLDLKPGDFLVDLCAAPGSKTTHLYARGDGKVKIIAVDKKAKRLEKVKENWQRLGYTSTDLNTLVGDGKELQLPSPELADAILVDAPCSGSGTIRRHPEILLRLKPEDLESYARTQMALLENALTLVKPGGQIVYSTCSLSSTENQEVSQAFLSQHPELVTLVQEKSFWINEEQDGFYVAKFIKC